MTQRTMSHICLWMMVLAGIVFLVSLFFVPVFAEVLSDMSDGEAQLPIIVQFILNLSGYTIQHAWFFGSLYIMLFIAVIVWSCKAKPQPEKT